MKDLPEGIVIVGRHVNMPGYYADYKKENEWKKCGHGLTVDEAIAEALRIKSGELKESEYQADDFKLRTHDNHVVDIGDKVYKHVCSFQDDGIKWAVIKRVIVTSDIDVFDYYAMVDNLLNDFNCERFMKL